MLSGRENEHFIKFIYPEKIYRKIHTFMEQDQNFLNDLVAEDFENRDLSVRQRRDLDYEGF